MCARTATRSTRASRRSSTLAVAWPGSRSGSARTRPPGSPARSSVPRAPVCPQSARGRFDRVRGVTRRVAGATVRPALLAQGATPWNPSKKRKVLIVFDRLGELASEHAELERALADPSVHADADQARTLAKRYAELTPIVTAFRAWQQAGEDEQAARELAPEDPSFAAEAGELAKHREELEDRLRVLLVPKDPNDDRDTILEVKAGEGGEESALFASDLLQQV